MNNFSLDRKFETKVSVHNWDTLLNLWSSNGKGIQFTKNNGIWEIKETLEDKTIFLLTRDSLNLDRKTVVDVYGLLGLSLINLQDSSVILTEGVSDYFTAKLNNPYKNVLGVANLGGSFLAKKIVVNLFDLVTICADSDPTGYKNALNWKMFLESFNKKVSIVVPETPFKDITDNFIFNLKLNE